MLAVCWCGGFWVARLDMVWKKCTICKISRCKCIAALFWGLPQSRLIKNRYFVSTERASAAKQEKQCKQGKARRGRAGLGMRDNWNPNRNFKLSSSIFGLNGSELAYSLVWLAYKNQCFQLVSRWWWKPGSSSFQLVAGVISWASWNKSNKFSSGDKLMVACN